MAQTTYWFKPVGKKKKKKEFCLIIAGKVNLLLGFTVWHVTSLLTLKEVLVILVCHVSLFPRSAKKKTLWISPRGHPSAQSPVTSCYVANNGFKMYFFIDISCLIGLFKAVESTAASLGKGTILHTHKHTHTKRLMHVPLKLACGQILNIHWEYIKIQERHDASVHTTALVWIYFLPGLQVHLIHLCFVETWFCISLFHLRALWRACIVGCWCVCAHSAFTQCIQWCLSTHPFVLSVFARLY